jgi:arylformamidase
MFIHGGYWRAFGKQDLSWIALPFIDAGISVAVLGYPLCPEVSLARISESVFRAVDYLTGTVLTREEQERVVLVGHSAGGHLSACYQSNPNARRADAIVCISGLFDLLPLKQMDMLASLNFEVPELHAASPLFAPAPASGQVLLAIGGEEPPEFHWQSMRLASAWSSCQPELMAVPQRNHFSVLEAFAEPEQLLFQRTLRYFR